MDKKSHSNNRQHSLGYRKRLKNRFMEFGIDHLQDYETIELLLTFALPQKDVKPIAKDLLTKFGSIKGLFDAKADDLKTIPYIKENAVVLIQLIKEINALYQKQKASSDSIPKSWNDLIAYCVEKIGWKEDEEFHVLFLDSKFHIIQDKEFNLKGTLDKVTVYPRKVMEEAIKNKAHALIFVHNHSSGNPQPSEQDILLTKALFLAAKALSIMVYDHIIVAGDKYTSFREQSLL